jgi:hypothetical protein
VLRKTLGDLQLGEAVHEVQVLLLQPSEVSARLLLASGHLLHHLQQSCAPGCCCETVCRRASTARVLRVS